MNTIKDVEILIIGAGITGAGCSILLQKAGYSTALIDSTNLEKFKAGESLSPECKSLLEHFSVEMTESEIQEYHGVDSCWGQRSVTRTDYIFNPYGNGISIAKNSFENKLVKKATELGCICSLASVVRQLEFKNTKWEIVVKNDSELKSFKAKFIIIATGRSSFSFLDSNQYTYLDKQVALTCILDQKTPLGTKEKFLKIRSFENGWLYANQIPEQKYAISLFTDSDLIEGRPEKFFSNFLSFPVCDQLVVKTVDARTRYTGNHSGKGWLRVGDAAYTIDPLSGQGIKKNIEMSVFCVDHIAAFLEDDNSIKKSYFKRNMDNFDSYLKKGKQVYQSENRFSNMPFWKRRNSNV